MCLSLSSCTSSSAIVVVVVVVHFVVFPVCLFCHFLSLLQDFDPPSELQVRGNELLLTKMEQRATHTHRGERPQPEVHTHVHIHPHTHTFSWPLTCCVVPGLRGEESRGRGGERGGGERRLDYKTSPNYKSKEWQEEYRCPAGSNLLTWTDQCVCRYVCLQTPAEGKIDIKIASCLPWTLIRRLKMLLMEEKCRDFIINMKNFHYWTW